MLCLSLGPRAGFYAGCTPAIQRAALVNLGELTTYDTAKKEIVQYTGDNLLCHLCSAICSGFVASLCSTPADVAKSRIMSQVPGPDGKLPYAGTLDCWRKVYSPSPSASASRYSHPRLLAQGRARETRTYRRTPTPTPHPHPHPHPRPLAVPLTLALSPTLALKPFP